MIELNAQTIAFFVFSIITLGGGIGVVANRNLVRGAIWLVVSLFGVAGLFVLLSAPFLAAVQVLVYIGAIAILITFSVMLTRSMTDIRDRFVRGWTNGVAGVLLFVVLIIGVIWPVWGTGGSLERSEPVALVEVATTVHLGEALVDGNQYVLPFEVASLLLTAAMIGAIVIAREDD
jgi:NADH-quinone oxidoreductase subunit J